MDEHQFKALVKQQSKLTVKGEFEARIRNKTCGTLARFVVVQGRINSPPLISKNTLIKLGMVQIREDGSFAQENDMKIEDPAPEIKVVTEDQGDRIKDVTERYSQVFNGIGKIRDIKNDKNFHIKFTMKPGAVPVAQKPRPVAYYLQKPLIRWLEQCIEEDIFEEVPEGEPVTWCSPLVVQPKPRFNETDKDELQPHMIRASIDLRIPNQFMERSRIAPTPTVEDFIYKFHDCTMFSELDMRQGYHQLILDPESRMVATFSTPWGNMRAKRLVFGAKSSQDMFDEAMYRIFGDIPRCLNQQDDILIGGRNAEEHDQALETMLQRAADFGITFNLEKCQFGVNEIEFYGHRFTQEGLKPSPAKVRAVQESKVPESKDAVRSFFGYDQLSIKVHSQILISYSTVESLDP